MDVRDVFGNRCQCPASGWLVTSFHEEEITDKLAKVSIESAEPGQIKDGDPISTITIAFSATVTGRHVVRLFVDSVGLEGSSFPVSVAPGPCCGKQCSVSSMIVNDVDEDEPTLNDHQNNNQEVGSDQQVKLSPFSPSIVISGGTAIAGSQDRFVVTCCDQFGNIRDRGGDVVKATMDRVSSDRVSVKDLSNGKYIVLVEPVCAGRCEIGVTVGCGGDGATPITTTPIYDSPFVFGVIADDAVGGKSEIVLSKSSKPLVVAGDEVRVAVQCRDSHNNHAFAKICVGGSNQEQEHSQQDENNRDNDGKDQEQHDLSKEPTVLTRQHVIANNQLQAYCVGGSVVRLSSDQQEQQHLSVAFEHMGSGLYVGTVWPTVSGSYHMTTTINEVEVGKSPFHFKAVPGPTDTSRCFVVGGNGVGSSCVAGKTVSVVLQGRDEHNNNVVDGGDEVCVTVDGRFAKSWVEDVKDGTYVCSFIACESGKREVCFSVNGSQIPESPFAIDCFPNVPSSKFTEVLSIDHVKSLVAGQTGGFTIQCRDEFGNKVTEGCADASVSLGPADPSLSSSLSPNNIEHQQQQLNNLSHKIVVKDNGDGTYDCALSIHVVAIYQVCCFFVCFWLQYSPFCKLLCDF